YLQDGTLDEVMKHKAANDDKMDEKEYKTYYEKGYKTDINNIDITKDTITFEKDDKRMTGHYVYDGKDILKYEKGNRGVRETYKLTDDNKALPKFVPFSYHNIARKHSAHFDSIKVDDK